MSALRQRSGDDEAEIVRQGERETPTRVFSGLPVSPGYGEGSAFTYRRRDYLARAAEGARAQGDPSAELSRLEAARRGARNELEAVSRGLKEGRDVDESSIFGAHVLILEDALFIGLMRDRIEKGGSAETAVAEAVASLEETFRQQVNPYLRERSVDVRDVGTRILRRLVDREHHPFTKLPDGAVIIADELLPSDTIFLERNRVRAIVTESGSENSHAAILSRALGIPAVSRVTGILSACPSEARVYVDGEAGRVFISIDETERSEYVRHAHAYEAAVREVSSLEERTVTRDGVEIVLLANVDREEEIRQCIERKAAGIGLLRTEFLYQFEGGTMTEDRQVEVYRRAARAMGGHPVNIRILDLAPDKPIQGLGNSPRGDASATESGIRYTLAHPEILRPQLRAVLLAGGLGNTRVLLPGVTGLAEVEAFRAVLKEVGRELGGEAKGVSESMPVGVMIETPSALLMLDAIAGAVDFLCLGTNDLLRHLFGRERVDMKETACEPSLLRAIAQAVQVASSQEKELSICGEVGGDPLFTMLLLGLGLRRLSMSPARIPEVRYNVSQARIDDCVPLADQALQAKSALEVEQLLRRDVDPWHRLVQAHSTR